MRINNQVENILAYSRVARNSDKELLIIYMQKYGMELTPLQIEKFRNMPAAETITRCRRQLQMRGIYPADQKVDDARFEKFKNVRHNIQNEDADKVLEPVNEKLL